MIYPEDTDVLLLICEDARVEVGNKVTVIGWYVGGDILLSGNEGEMGLSSLGIIFFLRRGSGTFELSTKITDPSGSTVAETSSLPFTMNDGVSSAQLLKIVPFRAKFGKYTVDLRVNDRLYHREFTVARQ